MAWYHLMAILLKYYDNATYVVFTHFQLQSPRISCTTGCDTHQVRLLLFLLPVCLPLVVPSALLHHRLLPWDPGPYLGPSTSSNGRFSLMTCKAAFLTLTGRAHPGVTPRVTEHPTSGHVREAVSRQAGHWRKNTQITSKLHRNLDKMFLKIK